MGDRAYLRTSLISLVIILAFVPWVLWTSQRTLQSTVNKPALWVSEQFQQRRDFDQFVDNFETHNQIVISWRGCTVDDERLLQLQRRLESPDQTAGGIRYNEIFTEVSSGYSALRELMEEPFELSRRAALWRLRRTLVGPEGSAHLFSIESLPGEAWQFLDEGLPHPALRHALRERDIELADDAVVGVVQPGKQWRVVDPRHSYLVRRVGDELHVLGHASCAVVGVTRNGDRFPDQVIAAVLDAAEQEVGLPRDAFHIAGDIVDGVAIDAENNRSNLLALPSALVSLVICWLCLRSFRLTGAVLIVAAFGEGLVLALVSWLGLQMNAVFAVMAPLVFVLTISAGVHLVNYYYEQRKEGSEGAVNRALRSGWVPCALAAITTAIGLGSLLVSDILPVWQFGMISSIGVLITTGLLFLVVPGAMVARGRQKGVPHLATMVSEGRFWGWLSRNVSRAPTLLAVLGILAIFGVGYGLRWIKTSVSVRDLLVSDSRTLRDYRWLEERIGPLVPIEIIVHFEKDCEWDILRRVELLRDIEETLRGQEETWVAGPAPPPAAQSPVDESAAAELPEPEVEPDQLEQLGGVISVATFTPPIPPPGRLRRMARRTYIRNRLEEQMDTYVEAHMLHLEDGRQSWRISTRAPALGDVDYGVLLNELKSRVDPLIANAWEQWVETKRATQTVPAREEPDIEGSPDDASPPADNQEETASGEGGKEAQEGEYSPLEPVEAPEEPPPPPPLVSATYTGLMPLVYTAQRALLQDLILSFVTALALVTLVMIVVQRSLAAGLLAMAPNVFPSAILFGAMGWLGLKVDIGTVMTASVALGIAVDGTLHFLTWYRRERGEGSSPRAAVERTYRHCGVAMTQTTLICGLGLLVFALSNFLPTRKFALMMVALLTAALVGDLVLLPALLLSPLGRVKSLSR